MSCFFEIWLRGYAKDYLRSIAAPDDTYHPHVTLVRPFRFVATERVVQDAVVGYCANKPPVPFTIGSSFTFSDGTQYLLVREDGRLRAFDSGLEQALQQHVRFYPKLNPTKIFHATYRGNDQVPDGQPIDQYMLRLTGIKEKRIWFSYDFMSGDVLNREQSLDKELWLETVGRFSAATGLTPTPEGFVKKK